MAVSVAAMALTREDMREGSAHVATAAPRSTWMLLRRGLRERRALRMLQTSQLAMHPRWARSSPTDRVQLAHLRRTSLARQRSAAATAHSSAAIAQLSAQQEESSAAPKMQARSPSSATAAAAVATASAVVGSSCAPARTIMPEGVGGGNGVAPERYLLDLLEQRGRSTKIVSSAQAGYRQSPTAKQIRDYDDSRPFLSNLVRGRDVDGLREAVKAGRGMVRRRRESYNNT